MLRIAQIGMNSSDMAGSLRLLSEVLGFVNAGAQALWGDPIRVQGLPPSSRALLWWLVGAQDMVQLELFHHTSPPQRPLPSDWTPADHGWVRLGIAVADLDHAIQALARNAVPTITQPACREGSRRVAFREPHVGCMIELIENTDLGPLPVLVYATSSVSDLSSARAHYADVLKLEIEPLEGLHQLEDEALWGLPGASRDGFVAHDGRIRLEVVRYDDPLGRPRPEDYRASDQGIVNVGFRGESRDDVAALLDQLRLQGLASPFVLDGAESISAYIVTPERENEFFAFPAPYLPMIGFEAAMPFIAAMDLQA